MDGLLGDVGGVSSMALLCLINSGDDCRSLARCGVLEYFWKAKENNCNQSMLIKMEECASKLNLLYCNVGNCYHKCLN